MDVVYNLRAKFNSFREFVFNEDPDDMEKVGSIYMPLTVVLVYLAFVLFIGPLIMKNRKPFKLNALMITFNVFIVVWNAYVSFNLLYLIIDGLRTRRMCGLTKNPEANAEYTMKAFKYVWLFYMSKYVDLVDTVIFVLRKKFRQITFLHVFHHSLIILGIWGGLWYKSRGAHIGVGFCINAFVHVCTYSYYALSACGPKVQRFLKNKKIYLTLIQVVQFWVILAYFLYGHFSKCEELDIMALWAMGFLLILMILFANFYRKNYKKLQ